MQINFTAGRQLRFHLFLAHFMLRYRGRGTQPGQRALFPEKAASEGAKQSGMKHCCSSPDYFYFKFTNFLDHFLGGLCTYLFSLTILWTTWSPPLIPLHFLRAVPFKNFGDIGITWRFYFKKKPDCLGCCLSF